MYVHYTTYSKKWKLKCINFVRFHKNLKIFLKKKSQQFSTSKNVKLDELKERFKKK